VLTRVDPEALERPTCRSRRRVGAIDGQTLCNAIDAEGRQTHILGVVGHQRQTRYTQKVGALPVGSGDEVKQTNEIGRVIPVLESFDIPGKTLTADAQGGPAQACRKPHRA
jgi:hypothetical protein